MLPLQNLTWWPIPATFNFCFWLGSSSEDYQKACSSTNCPVLHIETGLKIYEWNIIHQENWWLKVHSPINSMVNIVHLPPAPSKPTIDWNLSEPHAICLFIWRQKELYCCKIIKFQQSNASANKMKTSRFTKWKLGQKAGIANIN